VRMLRAYLYENYVESVVPIAFIRLGSLD